MTKITLSPQQLAAVEWVRNGSGNGYIEAVAGSGKTTALLECCAAVKGPVQFAAFNRKIADEIGARAAARGRDHGKGGTFHSFGLAAWKRMHRNVQAGPAAALSKRGLAFDRARTPGGARAKLAKLIGFCKQRAHTPESLSIVNVQEIIELYGLEDDFPGYRNQDTLEAIRDDTARLLQAHINLSDTYLDFDDMIYMPVITPGCPIYSTPWVMVDEAQDTNTARRELAFRMTKPDGGRMLFVGDVHQAIYGFSGADADAVNRIKADANCHEMPLTVTYRCPRAIVRQAAAIVPEITAHESAPEGVVRVVELNDRGVHFSEREHLKPADAILCRNTAPLVRTALRLLQQGMPCQVEGRDIGKSLDQLIVKLAPPHGRMMAFLDALGRYERAEVATCTAAGTPYKAQSVADRCETIRALAEDLGDARNAIGALRARIEELFQDSQERGRRMLTLSTVHKAKGREWPRVYILQHSALMPSKRARQGWELDQEHNLMYVAYTRAQSELVFVE